MLVRWADQTLIRALTATAFALLIPFTSGAHESHSGQVSTAVRVLSRAEPTGLQWRYSQHLDVNCDGSRDEVFTATTKERFYIAVVLGPVSNRSGHSIVAFGLTGDSQDSFCGEFESLKPEPLATSQELIEMVGEEPVGYHHSENCKGLRVLAGECDSFHLFWNQATSGLDWWRL